MSDIKTYTTKEQRTEMLKFYQTIPTNGEGNTVDFTYNSMDVRNDVIKLIADVETVTTALESQSRTIKTYEEVQQGWLDSHARNFKQTEDQKSEISSLITTIESLEINKQQDATQYANLRSLYYDMEREIEEKDTLIESQKEEIEKLQAIIHENVLAGFSEQADKAKVDTVTLKEIRVELTKMANYKAITELAVKGLREIVIGDESYHTTIFEATRWIDTIEVIANETLEKIERLQNAK